MSAFPRCRHAALTIDDREASCENCRWWRCPRSNIPAQAMIGFCKNSESTEFDKFTRHNYVCWEGWEEA